MKYGWSSIPVGLFTIGTLLGASLYEEQIPKGSGTRFAYGFYQDPARLLTFSGALMFYGTVVTQLFGQIRAQFMPWKDVGDGSGREKEKGSDDKRCDERPKGVRVSGSPGKPAGGSAEDSSATAPKSGGADVV